MRFRLLVGVSALAAAAALAGCGGSDSDSTLTKGEFLREADAICRKTDTAQRKDFKEYAEQNRVSSPSDEQEMILKVIFPSIEAEIEELEDLDLPAGDEETIDAIIARAQKALAEGRNDPASLNERKTPFTPADELAAEYGLQDCSEIL